MGLYEIYVYQLLTNLLLHALKEFLRIKINKTCFLQSTRSEWNRLANLAILIQGGGTVIFNKIIDKFAEALETETLTFSAIFDKYAFPVLKNLLMWLNGVSIWLSSGLLVKMLGGMPTFHILSMSPALQLISVACWCELWWAVDVGWSCRLWGRP